jgi:hypothetical protein
MRLASRYRGRSPHPLGSGGGPLTTGGPPDQRGTDRETAPIGHGPLAGAEPPAGEPLDDPVLADQANPRWSEGGADRAPAQSLANPDGTPNVMPPDDPHVPMPGPQERGVGTPQDQAARTLEPEVGRDNIREGRGGGAENPALAEGGESG